MIIWGRDASNDLNTGGTYDPSADSWTTTSLTNAPTARDSHTAVWTGSEMIIWGGFTAPTIVLNTGGRYCVQPPPPPSPTPTATATPTTRPVSDFRNLPPRSPVELFPWDPEQGQFGIDYGSDPGTPGSLLANDLSGFCEAARNILGDNPVGFTIDSNGDKIANTDDLLNLQDSLPPEYKWVGLASITLCDGIHIKAPEVDCPTMRNYFIIITGTTPEDLLIDQLPLPPTSGLKDFLRQRFNICTGLDLSGLDCQQLIDLAADLAPLLLPSIGMMLDNPIAKFLAKTILCGFDPDITLPDVDVPFPDLDFGFGGGCWFGCGDDGGGGSGELWFPAPEGQPSYDCSVVPADWATLTWGDLPNRASAAGVSVPMLLNSIIACNWPYPIAGFPRAPLTTPTPTATFTPTPTATFTPTPTATPTFTPTPEATATYTSTPSATATFTPTPEPTATYTPTPSATATFTPTPEPTATPTATATPVCAAQIQAPINADASSVFTARRGVVPVKFSLICNGNSTCDLPPATIAVTRTAGGVIGEVNESVYSDPSDSGSNFRIDSCQYIYNLTSNALGVGTYRVDILTNGQVVGSAVFKLK